MRLKTFTAPTMQEAMQMVRDALGDDAIIISTFRGGRGRGVQITAAVEPDPTPAVTAAAPADRPATKAIGKSKGNGTAPHGVEAGMVAEPFDADFLMQALLYHGTPAPLAGRICQLAASSGVDGDVLALASALDHMFGFHPHAVVAARPVMLVGPPGAGKTVTIAKLAARAALTKKPIHVFTTDTIRAGGVDQLASFTDILKIALKSCSSDKDLTAALGTIPKGQGVVIDSPGCNPYSDSEMADLARFVQAGDIEPVLVLPAGGDAHEISEIAQIFASLGARRMIITRLDMARRIGGMLTAADGGDLAFSDVSITPFVANGLSAINPVALARILLRDPTRPDERPELNRSRS